jgi:hypothetical protein
LAQAHPPLLPVIRDRLAIRIARSAERIGRATGESLFGYGFVN